jgi:hypothetical protein
MIGMRHLEGDRRSKRLAAVGVAKGFVTLVPAVIRCGEKKNVLTTRDINLHDASSFEMSEIKNVKVCHEDTPPDVACTNATAEG